jgi:hypothetical protein
MCSIKVEQLKKFLPVKIMAQPNSTSFENSYDFVRVVILKLALSKFP